MNKKQKEIEMLKVGILFEEQIYKMAVAELIDKHQRELELFLIFSQ